MLVAWFAHGLLLNMPVNADAQRRPPAARRPLGRRLLSRYFS
jgi:hypothetical protein